MVAFAHLRRLAPLLIAGALSGCIAGPSGNAHVPQPAKAVELPRYLGLWHEFARYDMAFEKGCEGVTARYALRPDGKIDVTNTCHAGAPDGPVKVAKGKATPVAGSNGAKLKVSFFGPALFANYWVLDRADDYSWAIVGEGSGRFLWILTREAQPSPARREELVQRVRALGYDTAMLRFTRQAPP
ncbi:lipocalin family protein [Phenylobacterium soli]|uniref:Outer membrane lipoprotein Blc n=1 Tax=Phenylobacterium soli TaxID=2170551 RepID=A0A328AFU7_9CAUL|nr:lipocalin family protein [Phenylobacterium soli]RAK53481.1 lipocalin [Phenylobacterium soli]